MGGEGHFSDGKTAARHQVDVLLDATGLRITSDAAEITKHWPYSAMRAIDPPREGTPFRLTSQADPDARLALSDPGVVRELRQRAPQLFQTGLGRPNVRRNAGIIILVLLALGLFLWQGLPRISAPLARLIPMEWEYDLGLKFRGRLLSGAGICTGEPGTAALSRLTNRLIAAMEAPPPLTVVVADRDMVNAFALPGGHIVVLRGLLEKAGGPDEVAAVLAHEIGHVSERHPTQMAIRVLGIGMIADLLTGDGSTIVEAISELGGALLLLSYSRDMEHQADAAGRALLRQAELSTDAMANFFNRMRKAAPAASGNSLAGYFSSHPPLAARIASEDETATRRPAALDASSWRALRNICG
ncbi:MAG: M48 family metallopeptidase [Alphaproteobacteria bacterium]|nr:M48 family metallopeptidase [Alphaproteobacteria bacterium]